VGNSEGHQNNTENDLGNTEDSSNIPYQTIGSVLPSDCATGVNPEQERAWEADDNY